MNRFILLFACAILAGCGTKELEEETYWSRSYDLSALYLTGDVFRAKEALWHQIRLDEAMMWSGQSEKLAPPGVTYNLALSYTRLALINEAQGRLESSEALFTFALRYWNETIDRIDGLWVADRDLAQFHVDSLDNAVDVRWRRDLDFPPTLYFPRFQVGKNGTLEPIDDGEN